MAVSDPVKDTSRSWQNHIVGYAVEPIDSFLANPKNYRRHPVEQRRLFRAVAEEVGIVAPVMVNDRTGFMIDGHMRIEEAMREGITELPVIHVDIPEEDEAIVLATYDPISAMAFEDAVAKAALLGGMESGNSDLQDYFDRELERQRAEAEDDESISELAERYGTHDPNSFWPAIRIKVPVEVRERFMAYFKTIEADDDVGRVVYMLDALDAPQLDLAAIIAAAQEES